MTNRNQSLIDGKIAKINEIKMKKKKPHGGARKGAGRPSTKEETVVIRVPKSKALYIKKLLNNK